MNGETYEGSCDLVPERALSDALPEVHSSHYGELEARGVANVDPGDAIAVEVPSNYCGSGEPVWALFLSSSISQEQADELRAKYGS